MRGQRQAAYTRAGPALLALQPANSDAPPQADPTWPPLYQHLEARMTALRQWRLSWWEHWAEIARYMLPRRYHAFVTANLYDRGLRRDWSIVDPTATLAGQICAAGMMSGITDPDRAWLNLAPAPPGFQLDRQGQIWLDDLMDRLRYVQAESNFYDSMAQLYEDLVFFGTAPVIDYEDADDIFHAFNPCAGEYFLASGYDFSDETLYREFYLTIAQIVEMFGIENCDEDIRRAWQQKGAALEQEVVMAHAIEPNFAVEGASGLGAVGQVPGGFTWREAYWLRGRSTTRPLSLSGFREKPFAVARWNTVSNDAYGRGPATDALGDTIQLQLETRRKAEAVEKVVRPPMGADPALKNQPASTRPGAITYINTQTGQKGMWPLYEVKPDIGALIGDIEQIQERIGRTFFNQLFAMIQQLRDETKERVTATEIDALREEKLLLLGPVIGRIHGALKERVRRQLAIMGRRGLIPPKPPSLRGVPLKIEFISMLTLAQRAAATASIERSFGFAGQLSAVDPEVIYQLDAKEAVREYAQMLAVPARIIRGAAQAKQLAAQARVKAAAAEGAQAAMAAAQGAKTLAQARTDTPSALTTLFGGAPQGQAA